MRHWSLLFLLLLGAAGSLRSQEKLPVVVVGIVVENMRPDYLQRFADQYSNDGFLKLSHEGWNCTSFTMDQLVQNHASGTATLFTGATPSRHGIVDLQWYDRAKATERHCVYDEKYVTVGTQSPRQGVSPSQLLTPTLADQLKMHTLGKSKVFSIALNSAPAVLSAGFSPDGVYWFDDLSGNMVTSSYYKKELPEWVKRFNDKKTARSLASKNWALLKPVSEYRECEADNDSLEVGFGPGKNTFPYQMEEMIKKGGDFSLLKATPFANTILKSFFLSLMEEENVGKDQYPDMVTVFFSSMDKFSTDFGPSSMEMEDLYLRLDQEIGEIIHFLENSFGKDRFVLYLTSNCSASYPVKILRDRYRIPSGIFAPESAHALLNTYLHAAFGDLRWTDYVSSNQVYLNLKLSGLNNVRPAEIREKAAEFLSQFDGIRLAVTADQIRQNIVPADLVKTMTRSYCPGRSGDVLFLLRDGWQPAMKNRVVPYTSQQQLPLLFYGGVKSAETDPAAYQGTDLAPVLCAILGIQPFIPGEGQAIELTERMRAK